MFRAAGDLYDWLRAHGIDPNDVAMILRAKDDRTRSLVEVAMRNDIEPQLIANAKLPIKMKGIKIHGMSVSISSLDSR